MTVWLSCGITCQIDEWEEDAVEDFNFICKAVPDMISVYHITFKEFKWARMTVGSRNFTITVNGVPMMCMVPLVDMINHSRPRQTRWKFVKSSNEFEVLAVKSILPGQEITDSYGEKCNSRLLLTYGFALSDNSDGDQTDSFNACAIFLPLSKDDPLYRTKCNLLGGEDLFEENNSFDFNLSNRYIKCLLNSSYYSHNTLNTFSRARIISIARIDEIPKKSNALGLLNQENELRSLELIKYSIQNTLRKYVACNQTTEQRSSRANTVDSINFDNAQILIQGEMQICKCWYETIENAVLLLSRTESKNDSATLNIVNENNSRNSYLREVIIPCLCHG